MRLNHQGESHFNTEPEALLQRMASRSQPWRAEIMFQAALVDSDTLHGRLFARHLAWKGAHAPLFPRANTCVALCQMLAARRFEHKLLPLLGFQGLGALKPLTHLLRGWDILITRLCSSQRVLRSENTGPSAQRDNPRLMLQESPGMRLPRATIVQLNQATSPLKRSAKERMRRWSAYSLVIVKY